MDWYSISKFLHIVSATIWLGGGLGMTLLAIRADRAGDDADLVKVIQNVVYLTPRFIIPASLSTLVFGVVMVLLGHRFADLWIVLGLAGFAVTFGIGVGLIKPVTDRLAGIIAQEGLTPAAIAQAKRLLQIVKFDMVLLYSIVGIMVLKPTPDDTGLLAILAVILCAAAVAFLGRLDRKAVPST
jgi:uncharacterized membrane protein